MCLFVVICVGFCSADILCTHVPYYLFSSDKSMKKSSTANVVLAKSISPLMFSPADKGKREHRELTQQMEDSSNNLEVCTMCKLAKSISPLMFSPMHEHQELTQQMEDSSNNLEVCTMCNSKAILFDVETSETVCSSCGMVLTDKAESLDDQWKEYSGNDIESKNRTGMPTSLAFHDMGLSTFISYSNVDANGGAITPDQISKVQRMRHWNRISDNNRSYHRNLKSAFAILSRCKG